MVHNEIEDDQRALAHALAGCSLLLLGTDALTPSFIQRVWGANTKVRKTLGGSRSNLAII